MSASLGLSVGSAGAEEPRALESGAAVTSFQRDRCRCAKVREAVAFLRIAIDLALYLTELARRC